MTILENNSPIPTTPFSHILDTNHTPNTQEAKEIRALLQDPEAEMERIRQAIEKLSARGVQLQEFTTKHRALLSPIRNVPPDILGEIFYYCLPSSLHHFPLRSLREAPLILTTVCRAWRDAALHTPRLWNMIHIQFPTLLAGQGDEAYRALVRRRLDGMKGWLSHSGTLPISFSLYISLDIEDDDELSQGQIDHATMKAQTFKEVMEFLLEYFPRWESVDFQIPAPLLRVLEASELVKKANSSQLRRLMLSRTCTARKNLDDSISWVDLNMIPSFLTLPSIRRISFHNERINLDELPERWNNLTHLTISARRYSIFTTPLNAVRAMSRCAHSLQYVMLDLLVERTGPLHLPVPVPGIMLALPNQAPEERWPDEKLELLKLETLVVRFDVEGRSNTSEIHQGTQKFFESMITPALKKLSIKLHNNFRGSMDCTKLPFLLLLERSSCQLSSLELCWPAADVHIISCLRGFGGSLRHLAITGDHYYRLRSNVHFASAAPPDRLITKKFLELLSPGTSRREADEEEDGDNLAVDTDTLCPKLEYLQFLIVDDESVPDFLTLAQSRQSVTDIIPTKLKYFQINFRRAIKNPKLVCARLKELRETGMRVRWRSVRGMGKVGKDHPADGVSSVSDDLRDPYVWDGQFSAAY
ncbi:hypothetical protein PM082_006597 [Marasmius tenuissimus]|nr:hypothetical protein PM082_006597 [Marasmius tenuissimus]